MNRSQPDSFPMAEAKRLVADLFKPNPWIYWADFLLHDFGGWAAFFFAFRSPDFSPAQMAWFLLSSLCLYRTVIFVHELTHLKKDTFRLFHGAWNLLCGFPLLVPSMLYQGVHIDHHRQALYGTKRDGEYFDFALERPLRILLFLASLALAPLLFWIRFGILTPLSYFWRALRKPLWERASSLAVSQGHKRPPPGEQDGKIWILQEFLTFAAADTAAGLLLFHVLPWKALTLWYLTAFLILFLNGLRTLAAHGYRNPPGREMNFTEQVLDSINIPGNPLTTPLWAPLGLRYHATHHLFPSMPYHHLGKAHRRLLSGLPPGSPYSRTLRRSLGEALAQLWSHSRGQSPRPGGPSGLRDQA